MKEEKIVVGFWWRILADGLDAILLGLFGLLLAIPLQNVFYGMGENGLWIGLIITFLYTGIMQSSIGQGQSLAKKLLKIQVLSLDGSYLSLTKSFLRYSVLAFIFYNQWIGMGIINAIPVLNNPTFETIYSIFCIVLMIGTVILVAMHPLKRGLQDLLVGSVVVRQGAFNREKLDALNDQSKTRNAFIYWGVFTLVIIAGFYYATQAQKSTAAMFKELTTMSQEITKSTSFNVKTLTVTHHFSNKAGEKESIGVNVVVFLNKKKFDDKVFRLGEIEKAVQIVIKSYSKLSECNYINVKVMTGYNIGLWSMYYNEDNPYTIDGKPIKK